MKNRNYENIIWSEYDFLKYLLDGAHQHHKFPKDQYDYCLGKVREIFFTAAKTGAIGDSKWRDHVPELWLGHEDLETIASKIEQKYDEAAGETPKEV